MPHELVKIVCQAVSARREGDRIVGEIVGDPVACYSSEELVAFYAKALDEIKLANELEAPPNRARRRAPKKKPAKPPAKGGRKT